MVSIEVIGIHLSGGAGHEHISELRWAVDGRSDLKPMCGMFTRQEMVDWLRGNPLSSAYVTDGVHTVPVLVVESHDPPYVRTRRDDVWTDNLLALPQNW